MIDINREIAALDWQREPLGLYEPIGYTLAAGGKRLRPTLALTACRIFGGNEQEVIPAALALEVFHNFTLLHDDVMDKAQVRRGRPCVHIKWDENTAILSGDQMLIEAYKLLAQLPADRLPEVLRLFNTMATEICEGQQRDVDLAQAASAEIADYMLMIRQKTAVLLATALQIGAYMAGADKAAQQALYEYGIRVGLAFQLQDDYLDCFGDERTFGKAIGGDIREGKKTWMWLQARAKGMPDTQGDVERTLAEYRRLGIDTMAHAEIQRLTDEAQTYLESLPRNEATDTLRRMAEQLATRMN